MLQLPCGVMVSPGMTREELLSLPEIRELINRLAYDRSVETYEGALSEQGHDEAFWLAADDYNCTALELQNKIVSRVRDCVVRQAERELNDRQSVAIMNLLWEQIASDPDMMMSLDLDGWDEEDYAVLYAPGTPPHYAADCQDCHHPNHKACSACSAFDA